MGKGGLIIGIIVLIAMAIGYIPCLGWTFWITLPVAFIGVILSAVGLLTNNNYGESKTPAITGLILCLFTLVFGFIRWAAGGFIL
jgi:hypothetical protein